MTHHVHVVATGILLNVSSACDPPVAFVLTQNTNQTPDELVLWPKFIFFSFHPHFCQLPGCSACFATCWVHPTFSIGACSSCGYSALSPKCISPFCGYHVNAQGLCLTILSNKIIPASHTDTVPKLGFILFKTLIAIWSNDLFLLSLSLTQIALHEYQDFALFLVSSWGPRQFLAQGRALWNEWAAAQVLYISAA